MGNGKPWQKQQPPYKLLIRHRLAPGDVLVCTAAIEALKRQYPGQYRVMVETSCDPVFENNPHVEPLINGECAVLELEYPAISRSNQEPIHFMGAFVENLAEQLNINLRLDCSRPSLYLSDAEKVRPELPLYCLINAGYKSDFTCKHPGRNVYQEIVDHFAGRLLFVQVGEKNPSHQHQPLEGVVDMIGKTSIRELIRLAYHSLLGVGPETFLGHVFAAFERPYVCFAGGRVPTSWIHYPTTTTLSTVGKLPCCEMGGCWKSRVRPQNDGSIFDKKLCVLPVLSCGEFVPQCMVDLGSEAAIEAINFIITKP